VFVILQFNYAAYLTQLQLCLRVVIYNFFGLINLQ